MYHFSIVILSLLYLNPAHCSNKISHIMRDSCLGYTILLNSIVIHELSHALTAKILWNSPIDVHIGRKGNHPPFFKLPGITIWNLFPSRASILNTLSKGVVPIYPIMGHCNVDIPSNVTPPQAIAVALAGPLSQIFANMVLLKKINNNPVFCFSSAWALLHGALQLVPSIEGKDGTKIYYICKAIWENQATPSVIQSIFYGTTYE